MTRIATCQCRSFRLIAAGEPEFVNICHCTECQRRSGVPLTCNAYFLKDNVRLEGEYKVYTRDAPDGRKLSNHFCPTCGSTVCWSFDLRPGHYGVAVGCFNDPDFPVPTISIWEQSKYAWTETPSGCQHFPQMRPIPQPSTSSG